MRSLPNIDKSAFRRGEYVGYGAGHVWRIRQTQFGGWKWAAHVPKDDTRATVYGDTLAMVSRQLAALPIDTARTLPAVNVVEG